MTSWLTSILFFHHTYLDLTVSTVVFVFFAIHTPSMETPRSRQKNWTCRAARVTLNPPPLLSPFPSFFFLNYCNNSAPPQPKKSRSACLSLWISLSSSLFILLLPKSFFSPSFFPFPFPPFLLFFPSFLSSCPPFFLFLFGIITIIQLHHNRKKAIKGSCFIVVEFLSPPKRYKKGGFKCFLSPFLMLVLSLSLSEALLLMPLLNQISNSELKPDFAYKTPFILTAS